MSTTSAKKLSTILDTDIGTDVDDAIAVSLLLSLVDPETVGLVTAVDRHATRAGIAVNLLHTLRYPHIPVASGPAPGLTGRMGTWGGWEPEFALASDVPPESAEATLTTILSARNAVRIICIGGLTNLARILVQRPDLARCVSQVTLMGGATAPVTVTGTTLPVEWETNLSVDFEAARIVFESGIAIRLVPANLTFRTRLLRSDYQRFADTGSELFHLIDRMASRFAESWRPAMSARGLAGYYESAVALLHDPLAVLAAVAPQHLTLETMRLHFDPDTAGPLLTPHPRGNLTAEVVTGVDEAWLSAFVTDALIEMAAGVRGSSCPPATPPK